MAMDAQISLTVGTGEFRARGSEAWVTERLNSFLEKADSLLSKAPIANPSHSRGGASPGNTGIVNGHEKRTLPAFLMEVKAAESQNRRFLATATWLHLKGTDRITTGDVAKALKDHNQARLGNPSDCLAACIGKGLCERDGKAFFVNDEGRKELGLVA